VCIIEKRGAETADWHGRQSQVGGGVAASAPLKTHAPRLRSGRYQLFSAFFGELRQFWPSSRKLLFSQFFLDSLAFI
jgi:hypothetical protein